MAPSSDSREENQVDCQGELRSYSQVKEQCKTDLKLRTVSEISNFKS